MKQRGFSLLEVLVAFSILALSLGVLMQLFSTSLRNATVSSDYAVATELAESLLAEWSAIATPEVAQHSGQHAERYRWSVSIEPVAEGNQGMPAVGRPLLRIKVRVHWSDGNGTPVRAVLLDTLRIFQPRAQSS
jgi:general secretion pathway protein I